MDILNKQTKPSLTKKVNGGGTREEGGLDGQTEWERRRQR